jgi:hypothetical protein
VLTQARCRAHRLFETRDHRGRQQSSDLALGRIDGPSAVTGLQMTMCDHLTGGVVAGVPDARFVGDLLNVDEIVLGTPGSDGLIEDVATGTAIGVGGEARVGGQVASADDLARQPLPLPSLAVPSIPV